MFLKGNKHFAEPEMRIVKFLNTPVMVSGDPYIVDPFDDLILEEEPGL